MTVTDRNETERIKSISYYHIWSIAMNTRVIEWDLPLAEISEASAREKNMRHGHPSTVHKWWARRPLASSRATNFAALLDLPDDEAARRAVQQLIARIVPWEAVKGGNDRNIVRAREMIASQWGDQRPRVLDPFSGGGAIPLEAIRLGCETHAMDYNPVAVLTELGTLTWPLRFGVDRAHPEGEVGVDGEVRRVNYLLSMLERYAVRAKERLDRALRPFYPEEPDGSVPYAYIWVRTIPCQNPQCGAEIPLIRQYWLSRKRTKKNKIAYRPIVDHETKTISFEIVRGTQSEIEAQFDPKAATVSRANARCLLCGQVTKGKITRQLAKEGKMGQRLVVVVLIHPDRRGKRYRIATERDVEAFEQAQRALEEKVAAWRGLESAIPDEKIAPIGTYGIDAQRYTVRREWGEIYNARQLVSILTMVEINKKIYAELLSSGVEEDFAAALVTYLAFINDKMIEKCSTLCRWLSTSESVIATFSRQALPIVWDFAETNPIINKPIKWVVKAVRHLTNASPERNYATVTRGSATSLPYPDDHFDAVFTDPPYYDNVPYSDLSDYFYVWLKRMVGDIYPGLFATPLSPKRLEAVAESMRQADPKAFFEEMLSEAFTEIHRVLKNEGIATIVYAHKTTAGWETVLNSLLNAGLVVTASWPIHTEMKARLRAKASAALASSIYMVCRKIEREPVGFWNDIAPQIEERVEEKLHQFWGEGIAGGDFFISAIGPGMEIYSRYERVEKYSGETVGTEDLLRSIRSITTDFIVNQLLLDASAARIDNSSQFYLAYRWTYLDNKVEFDDARRIASGMGVELSELAKQYGFVKFTRKYARVLGPQDRGAIPQLDTVVDVMHRCANLWAEGERDRVQEILDSTGYGATAAFWQFCQAIAETLPDKNKERKLLNGFTMIRDRYRRNVDAGGGGGGGQARLERFGG